MCSSWYNNWVKLISVATIYKKRLDREDYCHSGPACKYIKLSTHPGVCLSTSEHGSTHSSAYRITNYRADQYFHQRLWFLWWNSETICYVHKAVNWGPQNVTVNYKPLRVYGTLTNAGLFWCPERRRRNRLTVNKQNAHAVHCEMKRRQIFFNQSARLFCDCTK